MMKETALFDERYRVIAVDDQSLVLRGVRSGDVLTITNADPQSTAAAGGLSSWEVDRVKRSG